MEFGTNGIVNEAVCLIIVNSFCTVLKHNIVVPPAEIKPLKIVKIPFPQ